MIDSVSERVGKKNCGDVKTIEEKVYKLAGKEFNIASPLRLKKFCLKNWVSRRKV